MRTALPLLAVLALGFACNKVVDEDGDGFAEEYDCDDTNAAVHAGAAELCDGLDNDCDGEIDEDPVDGLVWFPDGDGDGFGVYGENVVRCEAPEGYVSNADDCDDADAAVNPDADEVCDGLDNDCSGLVDDDTSDGTTYYADWDGDGFGSDSVYGTFCTQPVGYVLAGGDCDDFDVLANPDQREICDTVDNDCDGTVDEPEEAYGATTFWMDADGDGYGDADASTFVCFMPEGYIDNDMDCDDTTADKSPGLEEICNDGIDNDCSGDSPECGVEGVLSTSDADITLTGESSSDYMGGYGAMDTADFDGDGYDDLVLGAYGHDTPSSSAGAVYVFYGPLEDTALGGADAGSKLSPPSSSYGQYMGRSVRNAGDVNGDGYDDLVAGGYYTYGGYTSGSYTGAGYLLYGSASGFDATETTSDHATFWGETSSQYFGGTVATLGDMNGDGYAEVGFGAYGNDDNETNGGSIYVFLGSSEEYSGSYDAEEADFTIQGDYYNYLGYYYGHSVSAGDVDGDGYSDALIGVPNYSSSDSFAGYGGAYLFYGSSSAPSGEIRASEGADAIFQGSNYADYFGRTTLVADLTGDGYDEVIIGEYYSTNGDVWVFQGGSTAMSGWYYANSDEFASFEGEASSDYFGYAIETGDWNDDGAADLGIGAPYADPGGNSSAGTYYVFHGSVVAGGYDGGDAHAMINGASSSNYLGHYDSAASGDLDGDGIDDVIVNSYQASSYAGQTYVFFGGGM